MLRRRAEAPTRLSLGLVLQAVGADVAYRALPVSAGDRDSDGDVTNPEIIEGLQAIVAELESRAYPSLRSRSARAEALAG